MKNDILLQISQYNIDCNRILKNNGKDFHLGFTYTKGKTPCIYLANNSDGLLVETIATVRTGNDLLNQFKTIHRIIRHL